jgi:hypothetical protein
LHVRIKKQKITAYHVFGKYRLKTIYGGRTKCLDALERYFNREYFEKKTTTTESLQTSPDEMEAFVEKKSKAARRRGFNQD